MSAKKSAPLNIRIDPSLKESLRIAADKDHRSMANMVEFLIFKHCLRKGIPVNLLPGEDDGNQIRSKA